MTKEKKISSRKNNTKKQNIIQLSLSLVIIILLNIIGSYVFTRFDLTSEKRYTLSDSNKQMIKDLDDIVYFRVYLEGDFPAGFKRLRKETKEMLEEFRAYNSDIQFEFINPSESPDKETRSNFYRQLDQKGLEPTILSTDENDVKSEQVIFPGALVSYQGKEMALQLLGSQMKQAPEVVLNNSIQSLEYNISNVIRKLTVKRKSKIAMIQGHGELEGIDIADITEALKEYYEVVPLKIDAQVSTSLTERKPDPNDSLKQVIRNKFKAIIIAQPETAFGEKDKFIIDQFVMRGGKVLWVIDPVFAKMDSLQNSNTVGFGMRLNLKDQLFKYGVRLNTDLIQDLNALSIPIKTGQYGNNPHFDLLPWLFSPVVMPTSKHPIVKNLNAIKCEFVSSIDTVGSLDVKKTILLASSEKSKTIKTPTRISLELLKEEPDVPTFNKRHLPIAVLLEGEFESVFKNRLVSEILDSKEIGFIEKSVANRMIVISDGDMIRNQIKYSKDGVYPLPLGYDKWTGSQFGNKEFILNAVNYLCDDEGLLSVRSRELKIRLLDKQKIDGSKLYWQLINVIIPILLIMVIGLILGFLRKKKYVKNLNPL